MVTTIPDADSEAIVSNWTGGDLWISLHTAAPGKTGANEVTAVSRQQILSADGWSLFENDVSTNARRKSTALLIDFGTASTTETATHMGFWTAEVGGTWRGAAALTQAQDLIAGNRITIPIGDGMIVGAGHGQA